MGVAGGSIKDAIMHDMAGGAGFQPSTVVVVVVVVLRGTGYGGGPYHWGGPRNVQHAPIYTVYLVYHGRKLTVNSVQVTSNT